MRLAPDRYREMIHGIGRRRLLLALQLAALLALPAVALAGPRHLPPDVDIDPDRGMSFTRMPKTAFDRRVFDPMKKALLSKVMDPTIEPYNSVVRPSRYDPSTGRIRDSITDALREMRHNEEMSRKYADVDKTPKNQPKPVVVVPGLIRPGRVMKSPVVDPMVALQKAQRKNDSDDSDD